MVGRGDCSSAFQTYHLFSLVLQGLCYKLKDPATWKGTDTLSQKVFSCAESSDLQVSQSGRGGFDKNNFKFCTSGDHKHNKEIMLDLKRGSVERPYPGWMGGAGGEWKCESETRMPKIEYRIPPKCFPGLPLGQVHACESEVGSLG